MPVFFTQLLPNLFYILATLFIFQLSSDRNHFYVDERKLKWRYFQFSFLSILLCISFPARFENGIIYDLRNIPFVVGSLYGGPVISLILLVITVIFRSLFGGMGVMVTAILCTMNLIVCSLWRGNFMS